MSIQHFNTFMLSLPDSCKDNSQEGVLRFTLPVTPHSCPLCHTVTAYVHDYRDQPIQAYLASSSNLKIIYRKRRYRCQDCGKVFFEQNNFIARYQRMPYSEFGDIIHEHAQTTSTSSIAERHHISPSTALRVFSMVSPDTMRLDEAISIDEFKGNAGAKFQVVINSMTRRKCLNILADRDGDNLYAAMMKYPYEERAKVKHVSIDLSSSFRKLVRECFPNAEIAADHFHAVKMANDALEAVRKEVQGSLSKEQRKYFKRSRRVLLKREEALTEEERQILSVILSFSDKLSAAYAMKEAYFRMYDGGAEEFNVGLEKFRDAVMRQNIKVFNTLLSTTRRWKKELIHGIESGYNNGFTEGCNNTIKTLKRVCYGFRNFVNFKRRIIFLLNDKGRGLRRTVCRSTLAYCA